MAADTSHSDKWVNSYIVEQLPLALYTVQQIENPKFCFEPQWSNFFLISCITCTIIVLLFMHVHIIIGTFQGPQATPPRRRPLPLWPLSRGWPGLMHSSSLTGYRDSYKNTPPLSQRYTIAECMTLCVWSS